MAAHSWTTPGVLRVRPLPHEATASYTHRLATHYRLTLPHLLDGAGITLNGSSSPPAAELRLNPAAHTALAALARIPPANLRRALPDPTRYDINRGTGPAAAYWTPLETRQQPVRACTACALHHSQGATDTAWVLPAPHQLVCPRHHQAAPDPRHTSVIHTQTAPELTAAHRNHQRLLRHPRANTA
ncbi:TniQ family protein [Streptomyces sp. NPDC004031]